MAKFNWEAVKDEVVGMRNDNKSLNDIVEYIDFRFGRKFTKGRISQVLKEWNKKETV